MAVTEALATMVNIKNEAYKITTDEIQVVSIGTGATLIPIKGFTDSDISEYPFLMLDQNKPKLTSDIKGLAEAILEEPPDAASYISHIALGGEARNGSTPRIIRLNPVIQPLLIDDKWMLPDGFKPKLFKRLMNLGMDAVEPQEVKDIIQLGYLWLSDKVPNQAVRYTTTNFACQIGYPKFSDALSAWK